ncbi:hypothetical protein V2J09_018530 [Rumex salicifolius]
MGHESGCISSLSDAQLEISRGNEISSIVHMVTEIVRGECDGVLMEKRLDALGVELDTEIVAHVLKRCFKVPSRAMKFFNWVKLRNGSCCTTEIYNTLIFMAGEKKDFNLVEQLADEMEQNRCVKDIKTWTVLIQHYGKAKMIGKALLLFEKMRRLGCQPDEMVYGSMIHLLSTAGKGEIALELYREMVKIEMAVGVSLYKKLLNCLAASGDVTGVHCVADDMIRVSQIPECEVYSHVLKSLCISQRIEEALELIRSLKSKNVTLDAEYFEILVKGLARADRIQDALEIVDIMKKKGVVNDKVYGAIISGYLRKDDIFRALGLFNYMKECGVRPLTSTYTELMQKLFDRNEYEKGCALFDEVLEKGVEMDSLAFMAMVAGHVRQNSISLAFEVFRMMEERGIRNTKKSYSVFIKELCKVSRTEEIIKLLIQMWDSKVTIGDGIFHLVISYLEMKKELVKAEDMRVMQRHYRNGLLQGETSRSHFSKEESQRKAIENRDPEMKDLPREPLSKPYNDEDLHNVCTILSSSKDWLAMKEALEKCNISYTPPIVVEILHRCSARGAAPLHFFSWVGNKIDFSHTSETYNMAIKIAGCGKDFKHMRSLFYEMKRNGCLVSPDTWTIMIMMYGRTGLTDIALHNFAEMKASGCKPTASTYKYLILSLCGRKGRKVEEAIKLYHQMINSALVPDKDLIESYLDCLCHTGRISDAKRCIQSLPKPDFSIPLSYSLLIRSLCRAAKLEEAMTVIDEVEEEHRSTVDQFVHGSLVNALLQRGRLDEALAKVDAMKLSGYRPTAHVYTSLLVHFFKEKNMEAALNMFRSMWEESCYPTIVTYSALLRGFMDMGKESDAWRLFYRMKFKGPYPDFKTYSAFITSLCDAGKSEDAVQLLTQMWDDGIVPSNVNFRVVVFGLNREGKQDLARTVLQQKHALVKKRKFLS